MQTVRAFGSRLLTSGFRRQSTAAAVKEVASLLKKKSPVNSFTEWDCLEEVIVGRIEGSCFAGPLHAPLGSIIFEQEGVMARQWAGQPFPPEIVKKAAKEVTEFVKVLELEGVKVVRPDPYDATKGFTTPEFSVDGSWTNTVPRDIFLVMGDTIVEAPIGLPNRFFDYLPYRTLMKSYFDRGAKWIACPKPSYRESLFVPESQFIHGEEKWATTEEQVVFDAASFIRCGQDVFVVRDHVTNQAGIEWLRRHFPQFRIHQLKFRNNHRAMHIDSSFMPLAPGKLLLNPLVPLDCGPIERTLETYDGQKVTFRLPEVLKHWDVLVAMSPAPNRGRNCFLMGASSNLLSVNVLSLDEKRVMVCESEPQIAEQFRKWGFTPISVRMDTAFNFGGAFHCMTTDIRRIGGMENYCS